MDQLVRFTFILFLIYLTNVRCPFWESINPGFFREINVRDREHGSVVGMLDVVLYAVIIR